MRFYVRSSYQIAPVTSGATGTVSSESDCKKEFGAARWALMLDEIDEKGSALLPHIVTCRNCGKSGDMDETWHHYEFRMTGPHVYACSTECGYRVLSKEWSWLDRAFGEVEKERDSWKKRASQHGCNTEEGDPDCG